MPFSNNEIAGPTFVQDVLELHHAGHEPGVMHNLGIVAVWLDEPKITEAPVLINGHHTWNNHLKAFKAVIPVDGSTEVAEKVKAIRVHVRPSTFGMEEAARHAGLKPGVDTYGFIDNDEKNTAGYTPVASFTRNAGEGNIIASTDFGLAEHDRCTSGHPIGHMSKAGILRLITMDAAVNAENGGLNDIIAVGTAIDMFSDNMPAYRSPLWRPSNRTAPEKVRELLSNIRVLQRYSNLPEAELRPRDILQACVERVEFIRGNLAAARRAA